MTQTYQTLYLEAYRVYKDTLVVRSITGDWYGLFPRDSWNGRKIFITQAKVEKWKWGYKIKPILHPEFFESIECERLVEKLRNMIKLHEDFMAIINVLRRLEELNYGSKYLEDLLNEFWKYEHYSIIEGYRRKNRLVLEILRKREISIIDAVQKLEKSEWKGVRKLIIHFYPDKVTKLLEWLMLRLCFRYYKYFTGYGWRRRRHIVRTSFEIVEDHIVNHWPVIVVLYPPIRDFVMEHFPGIYKKIKSIWGSPDNWTLPELYEVPSINSHMRDFNLGEGEYYIVEVDLPRVVYYGILGQAFGSWDETGYPRRVYYFDRDASISYDLRPGDIILAKLKTIWGQNTYVLTPLKKLTLEEIMSVVRSIRNVKVLCFDKPIDLLVEVIAKQKDPYDALRELESREPLLDVESFDLIKKMILKYIILNARKNLSESDVGGFYKILNTVCPEVFDILYRIGLTTEQINKIVEASLKKCSEHGDLLQILFEEIENTVRSVILSNINREWDISLLKLFPSVLEELIDRRIQDVTNRVIWRYIEDSRVIYDLSDFGESYYGRLIMRALKLSWKISEDTFKEVLKVAEKFKISLNILDITPFQRISTKHESILRSEIIHMKSIEDVKKKSIDLLFEIIDSDEQISLNYTAIKEVLGSEIYDKVKSRVENIYWRILREKLPEGQRVYSFKKLFAGNITNMLRRGINIDDGDLDIMIRYAAVLDLSFDEVNKHFPQLYKYAVRNRLFGCIKQISTTNAKNLLDDVKRELKKLNIVSYNGQLSLMDFCTKLLQAYGIDALSVIFFIYKKLGITIMPEPGEQNADRLLDNLEFVKGKIGIPIGYEIISLKDYLKEYEFYIVKKSRKYLLTHILMKLPSQIVGKIRRIYYRGIDELNIPLEDIKVIEVSNNLTVVMLTNISRNGIYMSFPLINAQPKLKKIFEQNRDNPQKLFQEMQKATKLIFDTSFHIIEPITNIMRVFIPIDL